MSAHSSQLRATVERYYVSVDSGDIDQLLGCFDAAAIYRRPGYPELRGRDDLRQFYEQTRVLDSGQHRLECVVEDGPFVMVAGRFDGRHRNGTEVSVEFADLFHGDDGGLISQRTTYFHVAAV